MTDIVLLQSLSGTGPGEVINVDTPDSQATDVFFEPGGHGDKIAAECRDMAYKCGAIAHGCGPNYNEEAALQMALVESTESQEYRDQQALEGAVAASQNYVEQKMAPCGMPNPEIACGPVKKRSKVERDSEFIDRTVNQVTGMIATCSPGKQNAVLNVLQQLGQDGNTLPKTILKGKTVKGTPAEGESPEMAQTLVETELLVIKRAAQK